MLKEKYLTLKPLKNLIMQVTCFSRLLISHIKHHEQLPLCTRNQTILPNFNRNIIKRIERFLSLKIKRFPELDLIALLSPTHASSLCLCYFILSNSEGQLAEYFAPDTPSPLHYRRWNTLLALPFSDFTVGRRELISKSTPTAGYYSSY